MKSKIISDSQSDELRILILEDVAEDAELVEQELRQGGIEFSSKRVDTEEDFMRELEDFSPRIILADYTLPSYDGLSALEMTRKHCPEVPFIFVSGTIGEQKAIEALRSGATDYVLKDHLPKLASAVKRAIQEAKERTKRKEAEDALRQSARELTIRNRISQIFLIFSRDKMYGEVLQVVLEAMESKYGIFGYIDKDGSLVCPSMTKDIWDQCKIPDKDIVFPREKWGGIWGKALMDRKTLYSNEPFKVPAGHIPITRALDVPIIHQEELIGNLLVANKATDYDEEEDRKLLEIIADHIAPVLHARLQRDREETERKTAEEELRKHREQLEDLVKERTNELEATQEELVKHEKLAVLGQLTSTVSHELRNPLGVIRSSAFYVESKLSDVDAKIIKHLKRIEKQVDLCDSIIGDLFEYTRGRCSEMLEGELNPFLQEVLYGIAFPEPVHMLREMAPDLPMVRFDREKLQRVVNNLVTNAIQAVVVRQEGWKEEDGPYRPQVKLATSVVENGVSIEVEDNGAGMDEETAARVFEPLFTTRARGTGLGLAIVKKIVEEHGGTVSLHSEPDRGTKVTVVIPDSAKPARHREVSAKADGPASGS